MKQLDIDRLLHSFPAAKLLETHISWIILTGNYAYKIKKPVRFSFLDFSTLEKRRFYCYRELALNQRLTSDIYLEVIPVTTFDDAITLDSKDGQLIDYAVKMRRLAEDRHMAYLLDHQLVTDQDVCQIARVIAPFHQNAERLSQPPDLKRRLEEFRDVRSVASFLAEQYGPEVSEVIEAAITTVENTLPHYESRLHKRWEAGFYIDGHGDLHSGNIFLLEQPVLFDCIEFNDQFRQLDVLDEIAFFCLDLAYYHQEQLEMPFLNCYQEIYPCLLTREDHWLFAFYKCYRANVKMKVQTLKAMQATQLKERTERLSRASGYYQLFRKYHEELPSR